MVGRTHALFSPQSGGSGGGSIPGEFDDAPIPLDGGGPRPVGPQPVKPPNAVRPREPEPQPVLVPRVATVTGGEPAPKIKAFEQRLSGKHEDKGWSRTPNSPGTGAIHVRSFHCKLNSESLEFLDQQINEWLDAHPQYEVKFVTTCIGEWTGKIREPNLIVQIWV